MKNQTTTTAPAPASGRADAPSRAHAINTVTLELNAATAVRPFDDGTWATVAPQLVGVCGTDLATVFFKLSPVLSALSSSPSTLGHEIFARIDRLPLKARDATGAPIAEGDGVVIDPFASCAVVHSTSFAPQTNLARWESPTADGSISRLIISHPQPE